MKLESSHTRICSAHIEGGKKKYSWQLPSIFPWSKPCKERKLPTRRALGFKDVLSETDLAVGAEFEFEAVVSDLYTGSISDKEIIIQSGFLDKLSKVDGVMVDKGFLIQDELAARQAHLVIPPLLKKKPQFSEEELDSTRSIANLRIHVERCMERIKNYHIFDRAFPISMADSASDIFCCDLCFS